MSLSPLLGTPENAEDEAEVCVLLCREGVQCNVVYLGGFSMRG